jgi:hypothetical protein
MAQNCSSFRENVDSLPYSQQKAMLSLFYRLTPHFLNIRFSVTFSLIHTDFKW